MLKCAGLTLVLVGLASFSVLSVSPQLAQAEDIDKVLEKVKSLVQTKNYPKAAEELGWAQKEIEKLHTSKIKEFLPGQLGGLQGGKFAIEGGFGLTSVQRAYQGEKAKVNVSLVGNDKGGAGGLAQLGKMAALLGPQGGGEESIRINGFTARIENAGEGESPALSVFLESGGILKFESENEGALELLKKMAEETNIAALDSYLSGQAT